METLETEEATTDHISNFNYLGNLKCDEENISIQDLKMWLNEFPIPLTFCKLHNKGHKFKTTM